MDIPSSPAAGPSLPTPPSVPTPEAGKPRNIATALVMLVLVAVLAYGVAAFLLQSWPFGGPAATPTPTPTPSVGAGSPWQTHGSVVTGFSLRLPGDMTFTEQANVDPADPSRKWVVLTMSGAALEGTIVINNPGSGAVAAAEPAATGAVSTDGITVNYRTGLYDHSMDGKPAGPERVWVGGFSAGGDSYSFSFIAADGADRTELVNTIIGSFTFPAGN